MTVSPRVESTPSDVAERVAPRRATPSICMHPDAPGV